MTYPDPYSFVGFAENYCLAESPNGYLCTEEPNHDNWHRAEVGDELLDTWPAL